MKDIEKIKPEELEALIVAEDYLRPDESTMTICVLTLWHGFNVTGESACLNPADFNEELGRQIARKNAFEKLWALEGYHRKALAEGPSNVVTDAMIAKVIHETNRAYCRFIGEQDAPSWDDAPEWMIKPLLNGVHFHLAGQADPRESHENWMRAKAADGWTYGPIKSEAKREHPCMVPYDDLPEAQKVKDHLFAAIVRAFVSAGKDAECAALVRCGNRVEADHG